jgi:hypothetical protein
MGTRTRISTMDQTVAPSATDQTRAVGQLVDCVACSMDGAQAIADPF